MSKLIPLCISKLFIVGLLSAWSFTSFAQPLESDIRSKLNLLTEDELVIESSSLLQENFYFFSEIIIDHLLTLNPNSCNYNYRKGFVLLDKRLNAKEALPYLQKASKSVDGNYDMYSSSEKSAPTDVIFHLGRCHQLNENFDSAVIYYNRFIEDSNPKSMLVAQAKLRIQQCDFAKKIKVKTTEQSIYNLGPNINTSDPELNPVVSTDGQILYFTSNRKWDDEEIEYTRDPIFNNYPSDIYQIKTEDLILKNDKSNFANKLSLCEAENKEIGIYISPEERQLYMFDDFMENGDIYVSNFENGQYNSFRKNLTKDLNSKYWETHFYQSLDSKQLFFVSDRPGGYGGKDIYCMDKTNNTWGKPYNLGPTVNTAYDEIAPFLASDGQTLFFSSNGIKSMGEFDILYSKFENGIWLESKNLGYPQNSTYDESFFTMTSFDKLGYLSSNRDGGFGQYDIYAIEMNEMLGKTTLLSGFIRTSDGSQLPTQIKAILKCTNCENNNTINLLPRLRDGNLISRLEPCKSYQLGFQKDENSTEMYMAEFTTDCNLNFEVIRKDLIYDVSRNRVIPEKSYAHLIHIIDSKSLKELENIDAVISFNNTEDTLNIDKLYASTLTNKMIYGDTLSFKIKLSKIGYITQEFSFDEQLLENDTIVSEFKLEPSVIGIDLASTLNLNPIYFDLNKFTIREDAKIELDKIVKIMNDNPEISIELSSHTDCRGSAEYNLALSQKRADASTNYIKTRILNPDRIYGKGYGETQLLNHCECDEKIKSKCSDFDHQKNRRTEFRIVKN